MTSTVKSRTNATEYLEELTSLLRGCYAKDSSSKAMLIVADASTRDFRVYSICASDAELLALATTAAAMMQEATMQQGSATKRVLN